MSLSIDAISDKEMREIVRQLLKQGWEVKRGGKHFKAYPPDESMSAVTVPCSPGGGRMAKNLRSQLRRKGADV